MDRMFRWANAIMDRVDLNQDRGISRDELETVFFPEQRQARRRRKILILFYKKHRPEKLVEVEQHRLRVLD